MKQPRFIFILSSLLLVLSFFAVQHKTHAAPDDGSLNLVTSSLPMNLSAQPGTTISNEIKVKNASNHPERLKVTLLKFSAYGEEGKPQIQERGPGDDYFDWVTFEPQEFDAPQNEWVSVKMNISLPKNAAFGYYYAVVFSRANTQATSKQKNTLQGSSAVLVLVDAENPNAKRSATITSFTADRKFYEFLPAKFNVKVRNDGNVHLAPVGNIVIKKGNTTVATLDVNKAAGNILPKSNRVFTATWDDGFPVYVQKEVDGKAQVDSKNNPVYGLKWDFSKANKLKFGRYSAHLLMAYNNGQNDVPMEAVVSFWVIPWRMILIIIGIPLVIIALVSYLLYSRRKIKKKLRTAPDTRPEHKL